MLNAYQRSSQVACLFAAIIFLFWQGLLSVKYFNFGYCDWDLAFFSQGMWGLLGGHAYSSVQDVSLLGNHSNLIAFLVAPLYAAIPHPLTLVALKILSYSLAGLILFHIGRPRIGEKSALIVQVLYYFYLPNAFGQLHDFDFESLSPAFLAALIYFFDTKRWRLFMITAALTMLIKENMPLIVAAFGLYGLLFEKDKWRWGIVPLVAGVVTFIVLVKFLIPFMATGSLQGQHPYAYQYSSLWNGGTGGAWRYVKDTLISPANFSLATDILAPLAFFPLFSWKITLIAFPIFLQHALSAAKTQHYIVFYYVLPMAPFLFYAFIQALERLKKFAPPVVAFGVMLWCAVMSFFQWQAFDPNIRSTLYCQTSCSSKDDIRSKWRLIDRVPPDKGVVATFAFLAPLSKNTELQSFHKLFYPPYHTNGYHWRLLKTITYALIDLDDRWFVSYSSASRHSRLKEAVQLLGVTDWNIMAVAGSAVLLNREAQ